MANLRLWKFNRITGFWAVARSVTPETADEWLRRWQHDEPNEFFVVSKNKPSKPPPAALRGPFTREIRAPHRSQKSQWTFLGTRSRDADSLEKSIEQLRNATDAVPAAVDRASERLRGNWARDAKDVMIEAHNALKTAIGGADLASSTASKSLSSLPRHAPFESAHRLVETHAQLLAHAKELRQTVSRATYGDPESVKLALDHLKREGAGVREMRTAPSRLPLPNELQRFAESVYRTIQDGDDDIAHFGDDKFFISSVYDDGGWAEEMTLEQFKRELLETHRKGLVVLSRADLVSAMDPNLVQRSHIADPLGADYHFINRDQTRKSVRRGMGYVEENQMAARKKKAAKKVDFSDQDDVLEEVARELDIPSYDLDIVTSTALESFGTGDVYEVRIKHNRNGKSWIVVENDDAMEELAVAVVKQDLEDEPEIFNKDFIERHINTDRLRRDLESDVQNMAEEDLREMNDRQFWKTAEGYIDVPEEDEDGEMPDPEEYIEDVAEKMTEERLKDPMEYLEEIYGDEAAAKAIEIAGIDIDAAAEEAVRDDGPEHFLARYDGNYYTTSPSGFVYWRDN